MKRFFITSVALLAVIGSYAQIGIGTTTPNDAAILHVSSESKGLLVPTISSFAEIDQNINALDATGKKNAVGMMVFYTPDRLFYTWNGVKWQCMNPVETDSSAGTVKPKDPYTKFGGHFEGTAKLEGDFTGGTGSEFNGYGSVPVGGIIMWHGETSGVFTSTGLGQGNLDGWALCNGKNGTIDLSGRFVVGTGYNGEARDIRDVDATTFSMGDKGGVAKYTFNNNEIPLRNHTHAVKGNTKNDGVHQHNAHNTLTMTETNGSNRRFLRLGTNGGTDNYVINKLDGSHSHNIDLETLNPTQTLTQTAHDNRPPYFALAFIMRIK